MPSATARTLVTVSAPLDVAAARLLLFNALIARRTGGAIRIRIDDRGARAPVAETLADDLAWLGFLDAGEYVRTSDRRPAYLEAAERLIRHERALAIDGIVVLRLPAGETVIDDAVTGPVAFDNRLLGDVILVGAGGHVNTAFGAAVDDAAFGTTLILREDRELERTATEQHILTALSAPLPGSAHIGVLLPEAETLPTIAQLRAEGIVPAALIEHLALLGWSPPDAQAAFAFDACVGMFSLDRLARAPAHFDEPRLHAINARALEALPRETLAAQLAAAMQRARLLETPPPDAARRWIDTFLDAYTGAFATLTEALDRVAELRAEAVVLPALELEKLRNRQVLFYLDAVGQYVDAQSELRDLPLRADLAAIAAEFGIADADAFATVRMALTGKSAGPPLGLLFPLLGHDRILIRIGAVNSHLLHGRGLEPIKYGPGGVPFETIKGERPT
jgi:glutamyl/glutaminyl-tRNA synthetase